MRRSTRQVSGLKSRNTTLLAQKGQLAWRDSSSGRTLAWLLLAAALLFSLVVRTRLLGVPFERDEGEFAYMGQLMLQGVPPYLTAYNMKLPGTYAAYALIMALFGQSIIAVHVGLLLVNLATIVLLFALARRLFGVVAAGAAALAFALLSTSGSVLGLAAHATHFVMLCAVGGLLLLTRALETGKRVGFFWSGLALGLAMLMKQPGAFFIVFGLIYLAYASLIDGAGLKKTAVRAGLFTLGAAAPLVLTCAILLPSGAFPEFYRQTVVLARANSLTIPEGLVALKDSIPSVFPAGLALWMLAGLGLTTLAWSKHIRARWVFIAGFVVTSCAAVTASYYFREHYFIMLLPAAALCVGGVVDALGDAFSTPPFRAIGRLVAAGLILAAGIITIQGQKTFLFEMTPEQVCRERYGGNPFPEAIQIAKYIAKHTKPNDKIAVLGSEAEIYFYARRKAATGHIYAYLLMRGTPAALKLQHEMIREIERAEPKYLVFVDVPSSWKDQPAKSHVDIIDWFKDYQKGYEIVGASRYFDQEYTEYYWDDDVARLQPGAPAVVYVMRRKDTQ